LRVADLEIRFIAAFRDQGVGSTGGRSLRDCVARDLSRVVHGFDPRVYAAGDAEAAFAVRSIGSSPRVRGTPSQNSTIHNTPSMAGGVDEFSMH
jgi:hypothetical protein